MNRNRVRRMAGLLLTSALLAFALVGCGGGEAVTVAPPPPPPPPFQPQPVEVDLGASEQSITLMTTEAGGYTLNGDPVTSGATHTAASGNNYTLTLSGDTWTAAFAPESMDVLLGASGQSITLTQLEAGGYGIDGTAVKTGATYPAANGNNYTLTMADGVWTAAFDPMMIEVALGASGETVTIVQMELGGYSLNGEAITADTTKQASNGATYGVGLGEDGMPMVVYIPTSVPVMLGMYGDEITLTLAEDQMTYLRDGEAFASGTVVISNDRHYTVTMGEDGWTAEFIKPMPIVRLGQSGMAITLIQDEAMAWWIDPETPLANGDTHTVGANDYTMTLSDGTWIATFAPRSMEATLGMSGESVMVTQVEAGGYMYNGMIVGDGAYAMATNGANYELVIDEDGMLMAMYMAKAVTVNLGDLGGTITLFLQEDQMTWLLEGETEAFMNGRVISIESIGNTYTVTLGEDGIWTAVYNKVEVPVDLGTSGEKLTLTRDEMGGWRTDSETPFNTGDTRTAENGNIYTLTFEGGEWTATYVPATMMVAGTGLTAVRNEDQTAEPGYHIMGDPDQKLDEKGLGSVMSPVGNFRVHMAADGNLTGVLYELAVNGENDGKAGHSIGGVSVIGDDAKTVSNEAGTMITIDGVKHSTADLFNTGMSTVEGDNIIAGVLEEVRSLAAQVKGLIAVNEQEGDNPTNFGDRFRAKWKAIDTALDMVFGDDSTDDTANPESETYDHIDRLPGAAGTALGEAAVEEMVKMLDAIVAALADADALATAISDDTVFKSERILGNAAQVAAETANAFNANDSTATAYLARTENTRFGVFTKQERTAADANFGDPTFGVFAYSPMKAARYVDLPNTGTALYAGRTLAVDGAGKTIYDADISLQVRFRGKRVSGLVWNLMDGDGNAFEYGFGKVAVISLAEATILNDGTFIKDAERTSQIVFTADPGSPQAVPLADRTADGDTVAGSSFAGQFVGDGAAAIGTWAINASTEKAENLSGAFGVERGEDVSGRGPDTADGGAKSVTSLDGTQAGIGSVNGNAVITLATGLTVKGTDLYASGGTTINGRGFVDEVVNAIQRQINVLTALIDLEESGDEAAADAGRASVWARLAEALDALFGAGTGVQVFSGNYPTGIGGDEDDDAAADRIADVLDALSSKTKFKTATAEGGILYGTGGLLGGAAFGDVFDRVMSTVTVEYGNTKFTRFGAWGRVSTTHANMAPSANNADSANGVFAYSPLAATTYSTADLNFPAGASATYEGATVARGADDANTIYEGSITIVVNWAGNLETATNVGTVSAAIDDLRNSEDVLYMNGGISVATILFTGDITVERDGTTSALSFNADNTNARLRHSSFRVPDAERTGDANFDGLFVGKGIDGPLGIIGSWGLTNSSGDDLAGAYGADLAP